MFYWLTSSDKKRLRKIKKADRKAKRKGKKYKFYGQRQALLDRVVDGDTLDVYMIKDKNEFLFRIRLLDVYAHELKPKKKRSNGEKVDEETRREIKKLAKQEKKYLESFFKDTDELIVDCGEKSDTDQRGEFEAFGRLLGVLYVNGVDINEKMREKIGDGNKYTKIR